MVYLIIGFEEKIDGKGWRTDVEPKLKEMGYHKINSGTFYSKDKTDVEVFLEMQSLLKENQLFNESIKNIGYVKGESQSLNSLK